MSSRLILVSHAETAAVRAAAFPRDESLDDAGRREAAALAGSLGMFSAVWVSPAKRAVETAAALGFEAKPDTELRDLDVGRWAGQSFADVEAGEPEAMVQWLRDPNASPHGGETIEALRARVSRWLSAPERQSGRTIAFTHPAVIRAAVVVAIDAGTQSFWRIDIAPLTIVDLRSHGGRWTLRSIKT